MPTEGKLTSETFMEVIVCIADNDQILWLFKLTSQSLQHWRQIGHKKPLSVWCYIGNWNWMLAKLYHCQKHTAALFLNFAKSSSDLIFHDSLILSTTTALQCWISVWEKEWNGPQSPLTLCNNTPCTLGSPAPTYSPKWALKFPSSMTCTQKHRLTNHLF